MKVFCQSKSARNGNTFYQGFAPGVGKITILNGVSKASGNDLLIVTLRKQYRKRAGGYRRKTSSRRSNYSRSNYRRRY